MTGTLGRWVATLRDMATEMVFSGGHRVSVAMTNAQTLIQTLNRPGLGKPIQTPSGQLAPGWIDIQTEDEGVILVNPASVAYVRDVDDHEPVMDIAG
jgi:hypothetical protein